jgi:hypothetical protein
MRPSCGFIGCASTTSLLVVMSATGMSHVETRLARLGGSGQPPQPAYKGPERASVREQRRQAGFDLSGRQAATFAL